VGCFSVVLDGFGYLLWLNYGFDFVYFLVAFGSIVVLFCLYYFVDSNLVWLLIYCCFCFLFECFVYDWCFGLMVVFLFNAIMFALLFECLWYKAAFRFCCLALCIVLDCLGLWFWFVGLCVLLVCFAMICFVGSFRFLGFVDFGFWCFVVYALELLCLVVGELFGVVFDVVCWLMLY